MSAATSLSSAATIQDEPQAPVEPGPDTNAPIIEEISDGWFFVGHSRAMRQARAMVQLIAQTNLPVLILGETGTGKEVIVRLIHLLSLRANRPFMKVNCAALPSELLESELFGYEPGAFTGAIRAKAGKFEACDNGTILLDEIAEMPAAPQAKLLQVLQDGEFSRLGSPKSIRVDVRVLAATNVDIGKAIRSQKLREDIYYRLNTFTIQLLPLRQRKEDIPVLIHHFMERYSAGLARAPLPISMRFLKACLQHPWPGNVRELENFLKRYLVVRDEEKAIRELETEANGGSVLVKTPAVNSASAQPADLKSLVRGLKQQAERQAILSALQSVDGSRKQAARLLNISLRALLYKMREYEIGWPASADADEVLQPAASE